MKWDDAVYFWDRRGDPRLCLTCQAFLRTATGFWHCLGCDRHWTLLAESCSYCGRQQDPMYIIEELML